MAIFKAAASGHTWPAFAGVVTLVVLTDGAVEAGFCVARRQRRLAVCAREGCVGAVTAVAEAKPCH